MQTHSSRAFTLVEGLISTALVLVLISGIWMLWVSGSKTSGSGQEMMEKFHRLRIVTEILKDDLREGAKILSPEGPGEKSSVLEFLKYTALEDEQPTPLLRVVRYSFDPSTEELVGVYGEDQQELIRTNLFESVEFHRFEAMGRDFVRMTFVIRPDNDPKKRPLSISHTVCPRRIGTHAAKPGWYSLKATRAVKE